MEEKELRDLIRVAIGYDPVPLSIRDHPEITFEYRTAKDRDGLIDRISAALLAATPKPTTAWIPIDLLFRDRNNGEVRLASKMLVEVVKHGNEVLFQDADNGTHRMVALEHIENTRTIGEKEDAPTQELCDRCGWALSGHLRSQYGLDCPPGGVRPGFRRSDVPEPSAEHAYQGNLSQDTCWVMVDGEMCRKPIEAHVGTQGEPSDAVVDAARGALPQFTLITREHMRAALRAAGKER